jgi:Fe-S-cluster containining protein
MNLEKKLLVLEGIYEIYDYFAKGLNIACKKYCANCCTRNVTMTTLEGYKIAYFLKLKGKTDLSAKIKDGLNKKRFLPKITINMLADYCLQGKDIPEEDSDERWGECPLVINKECPIYQVRPFGCRCFVSGTNCTENGYAQVDPFVFTVNSLFLQYIEHVDRGGYFGNLTDVLLFTQTEESRKLFEKGILKCEDIWMIPNRQINAYLVPPEHKARIKPILTALQNNHSYLDL